MPCCHHCQDAQDFFNEKMARRELKSYQRKGPMTSTRMLINAIRETGVRDATLLDIGGGIGAIDHELLQEGLEKATMIEASEAYIQTAKGEAERRGHAGRLTTHHGDFVEWAPKLSRADIVTLDRVLCCYPYMHELLTAALNKSDRMCGVVYPRINRVIRAGVYLGNLYFSLRRKAFRLYLHPRSEVDATFRRNGFERIRALTSWIWHVDLYRRT